MQTGGGLTQERRYRMEKYNTQRGLDTIRDRDNNFPSYFCNLARRYACDCDGVTAADIYDNVRAVRPLLA